MFRSNLCFLKIAAFPQCGAHERGGSGGADPRAYEREGHHEEEEEAEDTAGPREQFEFAIRIGERVGPNVCAFIGRLQAGFPVGLRRRLPNANPEHRPRMRKRRRSEEGATQEVAVEKSQRQTGERQGSRRDIQVAESEKQERHGGPAAGLEPLDIRQATVSGRRRALPAGEHRVQQRQRAHAGRLGEMLVHHPVRHGNQALVARAAEALRKPEQLLAALDTAGKVLPQRRPDSVPQREQQLLKLQRIRTKSPESLRQHPLERRPHPAPNHVAI